MKTKQIVFTKINTAELLDTEFSAPKAEEVAVSLEYSAISAGTERANITGLRNGTAQEEDKPSGFPRFCGYSSAGIVTETGSGVTDLQKGDRVAICWGLHKKHLTIPRSNVIKLPDSVSLQEASMALISTFPLAAIRKTRLEIGESAMVMGLGILGVFAVEELKAAGAVPVIAVDPVQERRDFARKLGADDALDPTSPDFYETVKKLTDGGVNIVIEVSGVGQGLIQALDCVKRFGRIALLGCTRSSDFKIDYYKKVHAPGITLIGAHTLARPGVDSYPGYWTTHDDMQAVLRLLQGGRLDFSRIISEIHTPEEAPEVFRRLVNDRNFPVGVLFDWTKMS